MGPSMVLNGKFSQPYNSQYLVRAWASDGVVYPLCMSSVFETITDSESDFALICFLIARYNNSGTNGLRTTAMHCNADIYCNLAIIFVLVECCNQS